MRRRRPAPAPRPAWIVIPVVALGAAAVALVIALAAVHAFYAILLFSILIAVAAAVFAALLAEVLGLARRPALALAGGMVAVAIYGLYWVFAWALAPGGAEAGLGLLDYAQLRAENTALGRRGRSWFGVAAPFAWLIWAVELAIAAGAAAWMTPQLTESLRNA